MFLAFLIKNCQNILHFDKIKSALTIDLIRKKKINEVVYIYKPGGGASFTQRSEIFQNKE